MIWAAAAAKVLKAIPLRVWAGIALLAVLAVGTAALRSHWISVGEARVQAKWDAATVKAIAEHAKRVEEVRLQEQAEAARQTAIAWNLFQENQNAQAEIDRLRRDLAAGTVRVRERFRCPSPGRVPEAADAASGGDAADAAGFTEADAGIALGIAARGDEAIRRLTACQAILGGGQ